MGVIDSLYATEDWDSLANTFLDGSNAVSLEKVPPGYYTQPEHRIEGKGYYGALVDAVSKGIQQSPLSSDDIQKWATMISDELVAAGGAPAMQELSSHVSARLTQVVNKGIELISKQPTDADIVSLLGDVLVRVERECSDMRDRRQLAHLLVNYIRSYFKAPLIVFSNKDASYNDAVSDPRYAKIYLVDKVREHVFFQGLLMRRTSAGVASDHYMSLVDRSKLRVEWHALLQARRKWEGEQKT